MIFSKDLAEAHEKNISLLKSIMVNDTVAVEAKDMINSILLSGGLCLGFSTDIKRESKSRMLNDYGYALYANVYLDGYFYFGVSGDIENRIYDDYSHIHSSTKNHRKSLMHLENYLSRNPEGYLVFVLETSANKKDILLMESLVIGTYLPDTQILNTPEEFKEHKPVKAIMSAALLFVKNKNISTVNRLTGVPRIVLLNLINHGAGGFDYFLYSKLITTKRVAYFQSVTGYHEWGINKFGVTA
jgi:hypothetical protein